MANEQSSARSVTNQEVESNPCFFVSITRNQAEDILRRYSVLPGRYLLRWSSSYGKIAVSCVIAEDTVDHALIFISKGQFYMEDGVCFDRLQQLLDYYSRVGIPNFSAKQINVTLTHPVHRFRRKMPYPWQNEEVEYAVIEDHNYDVVGQHINNWHNRVQAIVNGHPTRTPPANKQKLDESETNPKLLQIDAEAETFVKGPKILKQDCHYAGVGKTPKVAKQLPPSPEAPPVPRRRTLDM